MRTLEQCNRLLPSFKELLYNEASDNAPKEIIILGNGLSLLPIELKEIFKNLSRITVIDIINYKDLIEDLSEIQENNILKSKLQNGIISDYKKRAENLISEENKQNLKLVEAKIQQDGVSVVGINTIPENASIIINIMGPSNNTIKTQVGMLGYGGKLIATESKPYASNITIAFPLYAGKVLVGQVIERTGV